MNSADYVALVADHLDGPGATRVTEGLTEAPSRAGAGRGVGGIQREACFLSSSNGTRCTVVPVANR